MLHKSILSVLLFESIRARNSQTYSAPDACVSLLETLAHLSPLVSRFGGLTTHASSEGSETSFRELKYVFYASLDILSRYPFMCDRLIVRLAADNIISRVSEKSSGEQKICRIFRFMLNWDKIEQRHLLWKSKIVYILACMEQLVPHVSLSVLEGSVLPTCFP